MSDKPQETQGDILDEIMGRDPAYGGQTPSQPEAPAEPGPAPETPPVREDSDPKPEQEDKAPPKNKRSSVYIYLLILFGAAFMLLLMAYFVQMRNNETTISDLRDTMNLSREELMEQIETLEQEKADLQTLLQAMGGEQEKQKTEIEELEQDISTYEQYSMRNYWQMNMDITLAWLERFCAEEDWLMAAVVVEQGDYLFNPRNTVFHRSPPQSIDLDPTAIQTTRWLELRERVFDNAGYMALWQSNTGEDSSDYRERPEIHIDDARKDALDTAKRLFHTLMNYTHSHFVAAADVEAYYNPDGDDWNQLNGQNFSRSTLELLEQMKDELIQKGQLEEAEDGMLTVTDRSAIPDDDVSRETTGG